MPTEIKIKLSNGKEITLTVKELNELYTLIQQLKQDSIQIPIEHLRGTNAKLLDCATFIND